MDVLQQGLTEKEAQKLLEKYGLNQIIEEKKVDPVFLFLNQFKSPIIILLISASIVSFAITYFSSDPDYLDVILILGIVLMSSILGFIQEYKAEKSLELLKKMLTPKIRVLRDGSWKIIDAKFLVPGDIIKLSGGDIVPADAIILKGSLNLDESMLTGESKHIEKKENDIVFAGTVVYSGSALLRVINTGKNTKMGKIAKKLSEIEDTSVFLEQMKKFTNQLVFMSIFLIVFIFLISLFKFGFLESFLISVSLAVAAIPENLPVSITINLALGAKRMYEKNVLVRKLSSIETLGHVNVICTDKTGTITKGELSVVEIYTKADDLKLIHECAVNCNSAQKINNQYVGDETDIALLKFGKEKKKKIIYEIPFTSERKQHTVFLENGYCYTKGAPEKILGQCKYILVGNEILELNEELKKEIIDKINEYTQKGYRVLSLAYKEKFSKYEEKDFIFLALVCFEDPPRENVDKTIDECKKSGIKVIMITGDNPITAQAIAKQINLDSNGVLTGKDLEKMSKEEIYEKIFNENICVFARVDPIHKLKILESIKKNKEHIVAMTGDGVNDILALKKADVGIAMGKRGTEVAKQVSDIIILDDSFNTIVDGIKQGKLIFLNMQNFINYLLSCNLSEILIVVFTTLFSKEILFYPIHILWINFITDGLPSVAICFNQENKNTFYKKLDKEILSKNLIFDIVSNGILLGIFLILSFIMFYNIFNYNILKIATLIITLIILTQFIRLFLVIGDVELIFKNKVLIASLIISLVLQIILIYSPLSNIFKLTSLSFNDWIFLLFLTLVFFLFSKILKK